MLYSVLDTEQPRESYNLLNIKLKWPLFHSQEAAHAELSRGGGMLLRSAVLSVPRVVV